MSLEHLSGNDNPMMPGSLPLYPIDPCPGRDKRHDSRDDIDECVRRVVLVLARTPKLV